MQRLLTKGIGHTKFKKTELGEIPEEWKLQKLKIVRYNYWWNSINDPKLYDRWMNSLV